MTLPWDKWWFSAYENDAALRRCSAAAQGIWMRMLCRMHPAKPRGYLLFDGKQLATAEWATIFSQPTEVVAAAFDELREKGVLSLTSEGVIYNRRMVRTEKARPTHRENGKKGGNPALKPPGDGGEAALRDKLKREKDAERARRYRENKRGKAGGEAVDPPHAGEGSVTPVTRDASRSVTPRHVTITPPESVTLPDNVLVPQGKKTSVTGLSQRISPREEEDKKENNSETEVLGASAPPSPLTGEGPTDAPAATGAPHAAEVVVSMTERLAARAAAKQSSGGGS